MSILSEQYIRKGYKKLLCSKCGKPVKYKDFGGWDGRHRECLPIRLTNSNGISFWVEKEDASKIPPEALRR